MEETMKNRWLLSLTGALIFLFAQFQPVLADGIILPPTPPPCPQQEHSDRLCPTMVPGGSGFPLEVKYHHVDVKITDQLAETHVDQVFYNPSDQAVEGTYVFPLPLEAVVSDFTLWVDGQPVKGKVLSAEEARGIYEDIIRRQMDPALLEYIGRGAVQASIFPIPPHGERRIELSYSQALTADNGLVKYIYPLNTEKFSSDPLDNVAVKVDISSREPIRAVYSPSHTVDIHRTDENNVSASYEAANVKPDSDFSLYYSIGNAEAFHLLTYRDPSDARDSDGYFLALLAPRPDAGQTTAAKDVILVLDRSGSMDGEKIRQAKSAVAFILDHLNPEDRFQVITFSSELERFADSLQPAAEAGRAREWVEGISASGSTDINRALLEAAQTADRERPTYLIFMTDGLPTEGVQDTQSILDNFNAAARANLRLFSFGVGYDVDTTLLDSISQAAHGRSTYVRDDQNLEEILTGFYAGISTPVLTNLKLAFDGISVSDIYPQPLPDLFAGLQILVAGRYAGGGPGKVTLTGEVNGEPQRFVFEQQNFAIDSHAEKVASSSLPRLWATRRIGSLLTEVRLHGAERETIDQIIKLSIRFGIVTPYTSYLVTEGVELGDENQQRAAAETYNQLQAMPTQSAFGMDAVQKAAEQGAMSQADIAPAAPAPSNASGSEETVGIRYAGSKTFVLKDGVWMDTTYDPQVMTPERVAFLSPEYFSLIQSSPEMASILAMGRNMIVVVDGRAVEVTDAGGISGAGQPSANPTPTHSVSATPTANDTSMASTSEPKAAETVQTQTLAPRNASAWIWLIGFVVTLVGGGIFVGCGRF
jgi:Ca-activated chloride channel family protein